ncbi:MerR family transcriptional regulator [Desulfosediminicola sp.]|uniref:MerR family transcriptional regulator n=1 Tax=Desulfosediminicola sp. TaxID=2886825 RepID=UPI003AF29331
MKIRIMAGEMARLHNINKQTLIYYDKIGLFRPESTDEETGYRYYALEQTQILEVILILKQFGMPLKEIREFLDKAKTEDRISLLQQQLKMMEEKINQLQKNKTRISATITSLQKRMEVLPLEMSIKQLEKRYILTEAVAAPYDDYQLEISVRHLLGEENTDEENSYFFLYGFPTGLNDNIITYERVSLPLPETWADKHQNSEIIPEGWYACYNHQGPYPSIGDSWRKLLNHIERSEYVVAGDPLEKWYLDAMAVRESDDYLVELQIAVKKQ